MSIAATPITFSTFRVIGKGRCANRESHPAHEWRGFADYSEGPVQVMECPGIDKCANCNCIVETMAFKREGYCSIRCGKALGVLQ